MGKCVVCSKSAGPFNSLHKSCLSDYQGVRKCLHDTFPECVEPNQDAFDPLAAIQSCKSSADFSEVHFKELVFKAWLKQAKLVIKDSSLNVNATNHLLRIADAFNFSNEDIDDNLLVRLSNVEYLDRIQNNQSIEKDFGHIASDITLMQNEAIVWAFEDARKSEPLRYSQGKQWTILSSVLNNILMRKRYKALAVKVEESGTLFVTNHCLHYKNNEINSQTMYSDILSVTPMKNGVRVQAKTAGAMPDTYITGDGRFTYAVLQYAQGFND